MFPRHETASIHYKGSAAINLSINFTSRDLVDNYGLMAMQHAQWGEYWESRVKLGFLWREIKFANFKFNIVSGRG